MDLDRTTTEAMEVVAATETGTKMATAAVTNKTQTKTTMATTEVIMGMEAMDRMEGMEGTDNKLISLLQ